jgi:hypothetical protein
MLPPGQRIDFNTSFDAIHPEDRDAVRETFIRSLETGGTYEWRFRVLLSGGGVRWIATRCRIEAKVGGKRAGKMPSQAVSEPAQYCRFPACQNAR